MMKKNFNQIHQNEIFDENVVMFLFNRKAFINFKTRYLFRFSIKK